LSLGDSELRGHDDDPVKVREWPGRAEATQQVATSQRLVVDLLYLAKGPGIARQILGLGRVDADSIGRAELGANAAAHAGVIVVHVHLALGIYFVRRDRLPRRWRTCPVTAR